MKIDIKFSSLVFISLVASGVIFSGCGGGSSSTSSTSSGGTTTSSGGADTCPNSVSLTLEAVDWAAYRSGDGAWQVIAADKYPNAVVAIPVGTDCKFSTAFVCENDQLVTVSHLNSSDISEGVHSCNAGDEPTYTVSGQVNGIEDGNGAGVSIAWNSSSISQVAALAPTKMMRAVSYNYSLEGISAGVYDLAAVETDTNQIPLRFAINRDINITGDTSGKNIDISTGYGMEAYTVDITGADYSSVTFSTANDTHVYGIKKFDSNTWYKPTGGFINSDRISFNSGLNDEVNKNRISVGENKTLAEAGNYSYDLSAVPLLGATANNALPVRIDGLSYNNADLLYYQIYLKNEDSSGMSWSTYIAKGWLGNATTHLQDDFSALTGWKSEWNSFAAGKSLKWNASAYIARTASTTRSMRGAGFAFVDSFEAIFWLYIATWNTFTP